MIPLAQRLLDTETGDSVSLHASYRSMMTASGFVRAILLGFLSIAPLLVPSTARAQVGAGTPSAEIDRLRAELDRAHTEIAALKRERGVRTDYQLRQKMAEAEALARRLTAAEARLRRAGGTAAARSDVSLPSSGAAPAPGVTPPVAAIGDGPVELEAKADLLADQAHRLTAQADSLVRTAGQLRARQMLRRRAGELERDPFAGLESSKRSMALSSRSTSGTKSNPESAGTADSRDLNQPTAPPSPPTGAAPVPTVATPTTTPQAPAPSTQPIQPTAPAQPASTVSLGLRALLDPATFAEIQRLEQAGSVPANADAMEKAAVSLRQRAQALEAQSKTLRQKAKR
jgi:hypothetical protein